MSLFRKHPYADWLLGGFMFVLCAGLTVLQYRWTGEIARAEMTRLRGNLAEQAQAFAHEFDAELSAACSQLTPDRADFESQSPEAAHLARLKEWQATAARPIFSRVALGQAAGNQVQLTMLDRDSAQFVRANWPVEWVSLRKNLEDKLTEGSPPFEDPNGSLLEFPVRGATRQMHWLILEIDLAYAREHWLPELISQHLNSGQQTINDTRIQTGDATTVFTTTTNPAPSGSETISVRFNQLGKTGRNWPGPSPASPTWLLQTWQRPGALEATVATARRRNFAIAVCINLLMLATGVALIRHTRRARKLAEQQMSFVANVSHELRTPLTVIRGAAHNLKRGVVHTRSQVEQYSGLIIQHTEQLTDMIEQLLELAGARKNRAELAHKPVNLDKVLGDALATVEEDTKGAGCSIHIELPTTLPTVTGDAMALQRVFQNLITNAAKHGGDGGWIGVSAKTVNEHAPAQVEVRVADRGKGIPAAEQAEIFKPFVRGAWAEAKQIRGSGLGLSLVREIVELHRGSVSLESEPGHGATFIVRLPIAKDQA